MKTEKNKNEHTNIWLWLKGSRLLYGTGILAIGLSTLLMMGRPLVITYLLDNLLGGKESAIPAWYLSLLELYQSDQLIHNLLWCGLFFLLLTAFGGYFMYLKGIMTAKAAERTAELLRNRLYRSLQYASYDYHVKTESGDLIQRCTSDVETVRTFFALQLTEIGRALFIFTITSFIMYRLNVRMMLISVSLMPIIFIFSFYFFKRVRSKFQEVDEAEGSLSNVIQENLTGIRVVRAFARQQFEIEKYDEKNSAFRDRIYELLRLLAAYWSISEWTCMMQIALVVIVGGAMTANGTLTLGVYIAFIAYIERILWPVRQMGRILTDMGKMFVARDRIGAVLESDKEFREDEEGLASPISGKIEFQQVSFAYDEHSGVLDEISFTVEPGETVAILGPTGSGKSSLVHLLAGLYDPTGGQILIDGIPIEKYSKKSLRNQVGLVLQEPFLFNKSVRDNIALAEKEASDELVQEIADVAAVHSVIMKFDQKYETEVGEGGVTLSGGQRQRIAIARILIKDPPILIFDDSLSAVDTITDEEIREALKKRNKRATTFIISHRITSLSQADKILVIEHGKISEMGTHEELISQGGLYRRIWDIQSASLSIFKTPGSGVEAEGEAI